MPIVQLSEEEIRVLVAGLGELLAKARDDTGRVKPRELMEKLLKLEADKRT
jgi:hypothetical protein